MFNRLNSLESYKNHLAELMELDNSSSEIDNTKNIIKVLELKGIKQFDSLITSAGSSFMGLLYSDIQYALFIGFARKKGIALNRVAEYVDEGHKPHNYTSGCIYDAKKIALLKEMSEILNQCEVDLWEELSEDIRKLFDVLRVESKGDSKKKTIHAKYETPNKSKKALKKVTDTYLKKLHLQDTYDNTPKPMQDKKYYQMITLIKEFSDSLENDTYSNFGLPFEAFDKFNYMPISEFRTSLIQKCKKYKLKNYSHTIRNLKLSM